MSGEREPVLEVEQLLHTDTHLVVDLAAIETLGLGVAGELELDRRLVGGSLGAGDAQRLDGIHVAQVETVGLTRRVGRWTYTPRSTP